MLIKKLRKDTQLKGVNILFTTNKINHVLMNGFSCDIILLPIKLCDDKFYTNIKLVRLRKMVMLLQIKRKSIIKNLREY